MVLLNFYNNSFNFDNHFISQHQNESAKLAFYLTNQRLNQLNVITGHKSEIFQVIMTRQIGFGMDRNYYFYSLIEETLQQLIPTGIVKHLNDYHQWVLYERYDSEKNVGPKVLTMTDLEFGFVLWLIACLMCIAGFLLEVVYFYTYLKFMFLAKQLIGMILFVKLLALRLASSSYL